jgi:hypothetical protein
MYPHVENTKEGGEDQDKEEQCEIEAIVGDWIKNKQVEYLIKFKGFTNQHNQWVPLSEVCAPEAILHYKQSVWLISKPAHTVKAK